MIKMRTQNGFTLIETMVAVAILAVAIIGPFVAIQNALVASYSARDQLIASMLAQEGIEYVRGIRDGNYIYNVANPTAAVSWLAGIDSGTSCVNQNCTVDFQQKTHSVCSGACTPLNKNATSNLYSTQSGAGYSASPFTRTVRLTSITANREMQVTSTVTWSTGHRAFTITVTEILSNWL